ncbi:hypothetical protein DFP73DRAFT_583229 [Morchella snyderi]|nr:hypothetical protein DFP73DRAFT_583229 [Morchella snyderi]
MAPVRTKKKGRITLYSSPYKRHMGTILRGGQAPTTAPTTAPSIPASCSAVPFVVLSTRNTGIPLAAFLASAAIRSAEKGTTPLPQESLAIIAITSTTVVKDPLTQAIAAPEKPTTSTLLQRRPISTITLPDETPAAITTAITTCIDPRAVRKPVAAQYTSTTTPSLFASLFSRGSGRAHKNVGRPIPFKLFQRPPENGGMRLREDPVQNTAFNGGMFTQFLEESTEREKQDDLREEEKERERGSPMKLDSPVKVDMRVQEVDTSVVRKMFSTLTVAQSGPETNSANSNVSQHEDADTNGKEDVEQEKEEGEEEKRTNNANHSDAHTHVGQMPWVQEPTCRTNPARGAVPAGSHVSSLLAAIERSKALQALEESLPAHASAGCTATPSRSQSRAYAAVVEFLTPKAEINDATPMVVEKENQFGASPAFNLRQRSLSERRMGPIEGAAQGGEGGGGKGKVRVVVKAEAKKVEKYGAMMRRL